MSGDQQQLYRRQHHQQLLLMDTSLGVDKEVFVLEVVHIIEDKGELFENNYIIQQGFLGEWMNSVATLTDIALYVYIYIYIYRYCTVKEWSVHL